MSRAFGELLVHQSATVEILKRVSASPGDAQRVFEVILRRGVASDMSLDSPQVIAAYRRLFPLPPLRLSRRAARRDADGGSTAIHWYEITRQHVGVLDDFVGPQGVILREIGRIVGRLSA